MQNLNINLVLILIVIVIFVVFAMTIKRIKHKSSSIIILDKIKEINEYASHELNYFENISAEEVLRIFNKIDIPFIKKGFSITIIGKIKIGINIDNVKVSMFNKNINITIPEIKIISHETKLSEIGYQTKNPLFQNDFNDFNKELEEKKKIKENEILMNNELVRKVYDELKVKITDSLFSSLKTNKKLKINYKIEKPNLLIGDSNDESERIRDNNS